jgi:hypothetical protein
MTYTAEPGRCCELANLDLAFGTTPLASSSHTMVLTDLQL